MKYLRSRFGLGRETTKHRIKSRFSNSAKNSWTQVTSSDIQAATDWLKKWSRGTNVAKRVYQNYLDFCASAHLAPREGIIPWIGQALRVLKPTTMKCYLGHINRLGRLGRKDLLAAANRCAADCNIRTANRVPLDHLIQILLWPGCEPRMQTAIYMCLSTGCRVADLEYLRRNQISIDINGPWDEGPQRPDTNFRGLPRMVVNWRVTKNRKKPDQVGQTHVPLIWSTAPPDAVLADINEGDGEERIFSSLTTNQFNNTLRLATAALNLPVRPTSYTFRRRLLNEVDNYAQGDDEISARVSGHLDPKSMRYYKFGPKP